MGREENRRRSSLLHKFQSKIHIEWRNQLNKTIRNSWLKHKPDRLRRKKVANRKNFFSKQKNKWNLLRNPFRLSRMKKQTSRLSASIKPFRKLRHRRMRRRPDHRRILSQRYGTKQKRRSENSLHFNVSRSRGHSHLKMRRFS